MNELYWITRLDTICGLGCAFVIVGIIFSIALTIAHFGLSSEKDYHAVKTIRPYRITSYIVLFIGILIGVFVPTTKEAYIIYGVGGTIEYIKSNETAKQLPDKCIQALDKLINSYLDEE